MQHAALVPGAEHTTPLLTAAASLRALPPAASCGCCAVIGALSTCECAVLMREAPAAGSESSELDSDLHSKWLQSEDDMLGSCSGCISECTGM